MHGFTRFRTIMAVALAATLMVAGTAFAMAMADDSYSACLHKGKLSHVATGDTPDKECKDDELQIRWNAQGVPGQDGAQGPAGPAGVQGPQGPAGENGAAGADGAVGPAGPAGPQGERGEAGFAGAPGATGPQGPAGPSGVSGYVYRERTWTADDTTGSAFGGNVPCPLGTVALGGGGYLDRYNAQTALRSSTPSDLDDDGQPTRWSVVFTKTDRSAFTAGTVLTVQVSCARPN